MEEKHYYHAATKGLESDVLFSSEEQFIAGMNRVAFCRLLVPQVIVIAFVLMDNHIHFILHGSYSQCMNFIAQYRRLTEIWLIHNCPSEKNKRWEYDCWRIPNKEKLQEKICYVLRNPLAAGMNILPTSYPWGSGPLMFSGKKVEKFKSIGTMTEYGRRKLFGTKLELPQEWLMADTGMIWPGSYVDYRRCELAFSNITGFMYELNKRNEDAVNQEMYGNDIALSDADAKSIIISRAESEFGESDITLLTIPQRLELCRSINKSHSLGLKQLSRLLHIKYSDLLKLYQA